MLEVVNKQAEMLHTCEVTVRAAVHAIRTFVELWEEMKKHVLLNLNPVSIHLQGSHLS